MNSPDPDILHPRRATRGAAPGPQEDQPRSPPAPSAGARVLRRAAERQLRLGRGEGAGTPPGPAPRLPIGGRAGGRERWRTQAARPAVLPVQAARAPLGTPARSSVCCAQLCSPPPGPARAAGCCRPPPPRPCRPPTSSPRSSTTR